ncbi:MAG: hypothetical protein HY544_03840 [Candidatus Diapherotrites archaeon]|uniref:Uncharacterized protein n=1 Tax=Candidatus Iainarchaeum sp. TaxID=3101447 RepID=A0A8T3YR32_9ARCH|nr:hypothetical protein [Candidatus Diapherotrites archaeon]
MPDEAKKAEAPATAWNGRAGTGQENKPVAAPQEKKETKKEQKPAEKKKEAGEEAKKELLAKSEISLLLDNYDDIFSSFDPRPYSERSLSVDFLDEARRATVEAKLGSMQLRLMIPKSQRSTEHEATIKKRLRAHFKKHLGQLEAQKAGTFRNGALLTLAGFAILLAATYISAKWDAGLGASFMLVILEPSGWFTIWTGMEMAFYKSHKEKRELEFYGKMSRAEIIFVEY